MICKNLTVNEFKMEGNMAERVYTRAVILRLLHNLKFNKNFKSVYCLGIPALQQHSVFTLSSGYRFIGLFCVRRVFPCSYLLIFYSGLSYHLYYCQCSDAIFSLSICDMLNNF